MPAAPTPAIAALVRARIAFTLHPYHHLSGTTAFGDEVVQALGWAPERVFKTLVASVDGKLVVALVPVSAQLDLKALATAAGGKKAQLAQVADAERSSGYVVGGISPIGQRRRLPTVLDESAAEFGTVLVSAGQRGLQVELSPADLIAACAATTARIATG